MYKPTVVNSPAVEKPEDYDISEFGRQVFNMYDGERSLVELLCENSLMKNVVDHFGEEVRTESADCDHFIAAAEVPVSPTFFAWVFTYAGKIRIISLQNVVQDYRTQLDKAVSNT